MLVRPSKRLSLGHMSGLLIRSYISDFWVYDPISKPLMGVKGNLFDGLTSTSDYLPKYVTSLKY